MALQWRQPQNALKAAKTLGEMLITLALNYASPYFIYRGFDKELFKPNGFMVYEAFIRFKDGKVDAYGRLDDFDSTRHKVLLIKKAAAK